MKRHLRSVPMKRRPRSPNHALVLTAIGAWFVLPATSTNAQSRRHHGSRQPVTDGPANTKSGIPHSPSNRSRSTESPTNGSRILEVACGSGDTGLCQAAGGSCVRAIDGWRCQAGQIVVPQLCLTPQQQQQEGCYVGQGDVLDVTLSMTASSFPVDLVQLYLGYDPELLEPIAIDPAGGTFNTERIELADSGTLVYVVGDSDVNPVGPTMGPAPVALLQFRVLQDRCPTADGDLCVLVDHIPPTSINGEFIPLPCDGERYCMEAVPLDMNPPEFKCPFESGSTVEVSGDCNTVAVPLVFDRPAAFDTCDGPVPAECVARHFPTFPFSCTSNAQCITGTVCLDSDGDGVPDSCGAVRNDLVDGGDFPLGRTTITCTAQDTCGQQSACTFAVDNGGMSPFVVEVEVSPTIANTSLDRCFHFEFTDCDNPDIGKFTTDATITLGVPFYPSGHGAAVLEVPMATWKCIEATDILHTLTSSCDPVCEDTVFQNPDTGSTVDLGFVWHASFQDSPSQTGGVCHWLEGGNLNGDANIDIVDYAIWLSQAGTITEPNTACDFRAPCRNNGECADAFDKMGINYLANPKCVDVDPKTKTGVCTGMHADINGDGLVNTLDFTFALINFFHANKPDCEGFCIPGSQGRQAPRSSIDLAELRALIGPSADRADANGDGIVDLTDMTLVWEVMAPSDQAP